MSWRTGKHRTSGLESIAQPLLSCLVPNDKLHTVRLLIVALGFASCFTSKQIHRPYPIRPPGKPYKATTKDRGGVGTVGLLLPVWPSASGFRISRELVSSPVSLSPQPRGTRICIFTRYAGDLCVGKLENFFLSHSPLQCGGIRSSI